LETQDSQYAVEPFFFGETSQQLFGCYHRPGRVPSRSCGIVLCYPIGQEYILSHRAFYQLALKLSRMGFPVLRFDYFGCGDSAGDFVQGSLQRWADDIQTAAGALADLSKSNRIALLGLRMGATLSLMAAAQSDAFDTLVLWEPVVDGRCYVDELNEMHKGLARQIRNTGKHVPDMSDEVLGFPLTGELKKALESIQADQWGLGPAMRMLAVGNNPDGTCGMDLARLIKAHPHADNQVIGDHRVWCEELYKRLIPLPTMNFVVDWLDKVYP
jgi:uncharacterized protein